MAVRDTDTDHLQLRRTRRASVASFFGSMLEYYDFNIYAAASALVFTTVFFPAAEPGIGLLLSLASFGVAYIARPVGAIVLGHFGDRIGRKKIMLLTVILMGTSTFVIGCLPDYNAIGWLAPAALVLLRILQGFSAGGEQSGANALILEHSPKRRRGYFSSWTMTGTTAGVVLASLTFLPVAALPADVLFTWGWRIPFWMSAVVVVVAYVIRRKLEEPEVFREAVEQETAPRVPLFDVVLTHPVPVLRVVLLAASASIGTVFSVFGLAYATETVGVDRSVMLWVSITANALAVGLLPLLAAWSDRVGRKPIYIAGAIGCAVFVFVYFQAISTSNIPLIFLGGIGLTAVFYSAVIGVSTSFYPEMFHTRVRYTGSAIGTQLGYAVAGFFPTIGYAIMGEGVNGWVPVAVAAAIVCLIATVTALTAKETAFDDIEALGTQTKEDARTAAPSH